MSLRIANQPKSFRLPQVWPQVFHMPFQQRRVAALAALVLLGALVLLAQRSSPLERVTELAGAVAAEQSRSAATRGDVRDVEGPAPVKRAASRRAPPASSLFPSFSAWLGSHRGLIKQPPSQFDLTTQMNGPVRRAPALPCVLSACARSLGAQDTGALGATGPLSERAAAAHAHRWRS